MKVAIRVDASREIGYGHVVRCMALADALGRQGAEIVFMCQQLPGNAAQQIRDAGFLCWLLSPVDSVDEDIDQTSELLDHAPVWDWLVVDSYALSMRWFCALRSRVRYLMTIDDLANRLLDCDLLLDQNLHPDPFARYMGLVSPSCTCLFGPEFALLRPEFVCFRQSLLPRSGYVRRVLVCFGGADVQNATGSVLKTLLPAFGMLHFDVVVGAAYPYWSALQLLCANYPSVSLTQNAGDMAMRMVDADLFIGAGGSMTWERAALGLPGITIPIAENQQPLSKTLAEQGEGIDLGLLSVLNPLNLVDVFQHLLDNPMVVQSMGRMLAMRCDGRGAARVAQAMFERMA